MPASQTAALPQPHDLVWCHTTADLIPATDPLPDWVTTCWNPQQPLVVRRAIAAHGLTAVGIRGPQRHQRCAAWLHLSRIHQRLTPQQIAQAQAWQHHPDRHQLPPLIALLQLAPLLNQLQLQWGITGATGFELACQTRAIRSSSDLDLTIRCPDPVSPAEAQSWLAQLQQPDCRIDIQLETPYGGVALAEWARAGRQSLLKTAQGPLLVSNPWLPPAVPPSTPESEVKK